MFSGLESQGDHGLREAHNKKLVGTIDQLAPFFSTHYLKFSEKFSRKYKIGDEVCFSKVSM
jgi:hypothetical protein